jgi:hypothetical protein
MNDHQLAAEIAHHGGVAVVMGASRARNSQVERVG